MIDKSKKDNEPEKDTPEIKQSEDLKSKKQPDTNIKDELGSVAWINALGGVELGPLTGSWRPAIVSNIKDVYAPLIYSPDVETDKRVQELEYETVALKREINDLLGAKEQVTKLKEKIHEFEKNQRLQHLLSRVNEKARKKLLESEDFRKLFEQENPKAVIVSIDIRRSTELMLKAREPKLFAKFITTLCLESLAGIIIENYGIFDKFTGDGILAFFPDFYSGKDSAYWAIKAADECHQCFKKLYRENRSSFNSVLSDVGLGIGIDYGSVHIVQQQSAVTVIGTPVVYACRLSSAKAGDTLLNQPAYEITSKNHGEFVSFQEIEIEIKHEGKMLAYLANISKNTYSPKIPDWVG
jgi:class 3 adenylate cyclase